MDSRFYIHEYIGGCYFADKDIFILCCIYACTHVYNICNIYAHNMLHRFILTNTVCGSGACVLCVYVRTRA